MSIPTTSMFDIEISMQGVAAAGGSNARNACFKFHYFRSVLSLPFNPANIEAAFNAAVVPPILAALNARYTQTFTTVRCINDATQLPYQMPRAGVGGVAGDSMPMQDTVYVLFRTGTRGKSYRGCKHFFPLSESDTTGPNADVLNAGAIALWATAITAMAGTFTDADGNVWRPEIYSKKLSQDRVNPTTIIATPVTALLLNKRIGRMRKRERVSVY